MNLMSSAVSTELVDGVVSVFDDVLVAGIVFEGQLSEKVTLAFVVVNFSARVRGISEIEFVE